MRPSVPHSPGGAKVAALRLSFFFQSCSPFAIVPPGLWNPSEIPGFDGGAVEDVPVGDPMRRFVPMRNPVSSGTDDAIKRLAGGGKFRAGLRGNDHIDKRVHDGVGYAGPILRALCGCGLR